jgi:recombination associated protein RdgC
MWFRNLTTYRLTQPLTISQGELEEALNKKLARECANQEISTFGFVSPFEPKETDRTDASPSLSHWSNNAFLIAARSETKNLPGQVVRDELEAKVKSIEAEQIRKIYKKERDQLKDEIIQALLPRAFIKRSTIFAYFDLDSGLVYVDSASPKKAEDILSTLREAIGSLPLRPVSVKIAPSATMTEWLKLKKSAENFIVLGNCTLTDSQDDGGSVKLKDQDLTSEEVALHLAAGKQVTSLALAYEQTMSFVLSDRLIITKLRYEDLLLDQAIKDGGDDKKTQLDAAFTLMVLNNRKFYPLFLEALGGEDLPQGI